MEKQSLYHISYISRSNLDGSDREKKNEIEKILAAANARNSTENVTGALLYSGGYFAQILEGEEQAVKKIFESIKSDSRHSYIYEISSHEHLEGRSFADWSMAFVGFYAKLIPGVEDLLIPPEDINVESTGLALLNLLSELLRCNEENTQSIKAKA